ncbi:MAG: mandelate racemase/muconate lactonizing enzyme family protein [Advenella sp.]
MVNIEKITTRIVALPLERPIQHVYLGARTQFATLIVQVYTTDGCIGFGYASIESVPMVSAVRCIVQGLAPYMRGQDALRRESLYERMWQLTVDLLHDGAVNLALAAIDVALWDIAGKQAGMPLWKLLGGFRQAVPAYASWTLWRHMSLAELESEGCDVVAKGYRAMKLRLGGSRSLGEDIQRAKALRTAVGQDAIIMVDALWGMTVDQGLRLAQALAELNYAWLEEPVREGDFTGLGRTRAAQALPIAGGERISRVTGIDSLAAVVDHAILDAHHLGGITPWLKAAAAIETHNLPLSAHSHPAVHMHLLAAARTGAWIEFMPWWDLLFIEPPQPQDGMLHLSDKPGLGLELDESAIARFNVGGRE